MKVITINNIDKTKDEFKKKYKSRALLTNSRGEILIAKYGGVFLLPGGKVENGETPELTILRELKEEVGKDFEKGQLHPLAKIEYFQPSYPNRKGTSENRLLVTYYFTGKIEEVSSERSLTDKEIKDGFDAQFYSLNQIEEIISNNNSDNPRKEYFDKELIEIVKYYKEYIKQKDDKSEHER